jgi:hypothetical protein
MPDRRIPASFVLLLLSFASTAAFAQGGSAPPPAPRTHRWLDWQVATLDARYRVIENSRKVTTTQQVQWRETARLGFLFDRQHRYSVQTLAGTGTTFSGSWDPLGPGTGEGSWDPSIRQLYLSATPAHGASFELGGFGLLRGEGTEITTWDNDGFMTGERATLRRPRELFFDEISVTAGFLGDVTTPNVFRRFDRLDDHNYTQVLAARRIAPRLAASADWTSFDGVSTIREAVRITTKSRAPIDAVRLELYQRVEGTRGSGFALSAERAVTAAVAVTGGYADIDEHYGPLNADRFGIGRRLFTELRYAVLPTLTVSAFYGIAVDTPFAIPNRQRFDLVASWNLLKAAQRARQW